VVSKYQLAILVLRAAITSPAAFENVTGASPGGQLRHFCVPEYAASTCHLSISTGRPPSEVTQSISSRAPCVACTIFEISSIGWQSPGRGLRMDDARPLSGDGTA
jgi:hypothetical protein